MNKSLSVSNSFRLFPEDGLVEKDEWLAFLNGVRIIKIICVSKNTNFTAPFGSICLRRQIQNTRATPLQM